MNPILKSIRGTIFEPIIVVFWIVYAILEIISPILVFLMWWNS